MPVRLLSQDQCQWAMARKCLARHDGWSCVLVVAVPVVLFLDMHPLAGLKKDGRFEICKADLFFLQRHSVSLFSLLPSHGRITLALRSKQCGTLGFCEAV